MNVSKTRSRKKQVKHEKFTINNVHEHKRKTGHAKILRKDTHVHNNCFKLRLREIKKVKCADEKKPTNVAWIALEERQAGGFNLGV